MRWAISAILLVHGLIHVLGFAKAFELAALPQLTRPISRPMGVTWLVSGLGFVLAALLPWRLFWPVALLAVVGSQVAIIGSWADAKFGTGANVVALFVALWAFAATGPFSLRAQWGAEVDAMLAAAPKTMGLVTEEDVSRAPEPVRTFLRRSGVVGQPRLATFRLSWKGRIRAAPDSPWMELEGTQYNDATGAMPARLFLFGAVMKGLPATVFHRFIGDDATFRARLLDVVPVVSAEGPELQRAETVTIFNDLCLFAPEVLVSDAVRLEAIDAGSVRAFFTRGSQTVSAELHFSSEGALVDFISDDRLRGPLDDGRFERTRWSTPIGPLRTFGARRVPGSGLAKWHPASGEFTYVELELVDFEANPVAR